MTDDLNCGGQYIPIIDYVIVDRIYPLYQSKL